MLVTRTCKPHVRDLINICTVYEVETYVISNLVIGPGTENFVKDLGSCLKRVPGDDEAYIQLMQRFSVAIQRRNCASVLAFLLTQSQIYFNYYTLF